MNFTSFRREFDLNVFQEMKDIHSSRPFQRWRQLTDNCFASRKRVVFLFSWRAISSKTFSRGIGFLLCRRLQSKGFAHSHIRNAATPAQVIAFRIRAILIGKWQRPTNRHISVSVLRHRQMHSSRNSDISAIDRCRLFLNGPFKPTHEKQQAKKEYENEQTLMSSSYFHMFIVKMKGKRWRCFEVSLKTFTWWQCM